MSSNPQSVPASDLSSNRALIANAAGWFGLIMLIGYLLYWGVTGNNFDLPAKVLLILGLLAIRCRRRTMASRRARCHVRRKAGET